MTKPLTAYSPNVAVLGKKEVRSEVGGWLSVTQSKDTTMEERDRVGRQAAQTLFGGPNGSSKASVQQYLRRYSRILTNEQLWLVYQRTPDVRACVDAIVRRVATWDWMVEPVLPPSDPNYQRALEVARRSEKFLQAPNIDGETWQELWTKVGTDLMIFDAGCIENVFDGKYEEEVFVPEGDLQELVALRGSSIYPVVDEHGHILGYKQNANGFDWPVQWGSAKDEGGESVPVFGPDQIIYLRLFPNTASPMGVPIIESIVNEIITMLRSSEHTMLAVDADEIPPGILVLTGMAGAAADAARQDLQRLRGKDHKIRVITNPDPKATGAHWVELRHKAKDVDFVNVIAQVRKTIWRVFGVLPIEMGASENIPRSVGQVQLDVSTSHLINPILELIEAKVNARMLPNVVGNAEDLEMVRFRFDRESKLSPSQQKEKASSLNTFVMQGLMSRNEARAEIGLPPIVGGDVVTITTGQGTFPLDLILSSAAGQGPEGSGSDDGNAPPTQGGPGTPSGPSSPGEVDVSEENSQRLEDSKKKQNRAVGDTNPTNFPKAGEDLKVSLRNSRYKVFDKEFAADLKKNYPSIWEKGGNIKGNEQYKDLTPVVYRGGVVENDREEEAVRLREAWSARHFKDNRVAGVVAQIKWYTVGTLGEPEMKSLINEEKKKLEKSKKKIEHVHSHNLKECKICSSHDTYSERAWITEFLPDHWAPNGMFKKYRTINLTELHEQINKYNRLITPMWDDMVEDFLYALAARYENGLSEESASEMNNLVGKSIDKLFEQWKMVTGPIYVETSKIGMLASSNYAGVPIANSYTDFGQLYQDSAMGYLITEGGLLNDVSAKMIALIAGMTRDSSIQRAQEQEVPDPLILDLDADEAALAAAAAIDSEKYRIRNWAGKLVELANSAMADGVLESHTVDSEGTVVAAEWYAEWVNAGDNRMCATCTQQGSLGFRPLSQFNTMPGGDTECGANCRCVIVLWTKEEVDSGEAVTLTGYDVE